MLHFTPSWRFYVELCLFFVFILFPSEPLKVKQVKQHQNCDVRETNSSPNSSSFIIQLHLWVWLQFRWISTNHHPPGKPCIPNELVGIHTHKIPLYRLNIIMWLSVIQSLVSIYHYHSKLMKLEKCHKDYNYELWHIMAHVTLQGVLSAWMFLVHVPSWNNMMKAGWMLGLP